MRKFFDPSEAIVSPSRIVYAFTGSKADALSLPSRAVIAFSSGDLQRVVRSRSAVLQKAWSPFRSLYRVDGSSTVITNCRFGGPNIAALVEELAAFGVLECALWGYCGAIHESMKIGDVVIAQRALREEGTSCHYLDTDDDFVESNWFDEWSADAGDHGFRTGSVWTCDAIYRETRDKVERYRDLGVLGVEMETASFYAVCRARGIKGIAFLVVSDTLFGGVWRSGFHTKPFKEGVRVLTEFMLKRVLT